MGINSRSALHRDWVNHHIPVKESFQTCQIRVLRPDENARLTYNQTTRVYSYENGAAPAVVYEGTARVQPYALNFDIINGNDPTSRRMTLVQISGKDTVIQNDDIVVVDSVTNNGALPFYILDVRGGIGSSLEWGTNLICEASTKVGLID